MLVMALADDGGTFGPLLRTVLEAIFEVFLMCSVGWLLAKKGILDKKTQKNINRINVSLFTPCLLFSKVAFSLTPAKLKELYIIPIFFVLVTSVSAIVAWVLGHVLRLKRSQRNFAIAASMFNNSNSLPIALMQSLVVTVHGLKWGPDDTRDAMLGRALGYLVVYSTMGMVLRWSFGVHLLTQADEEMLVQQGSLEQGSGAPVPVESPVMGLGMLQEDSTTGYFSPLIASGISAPPQPAFGDESAPALMAGASGSRATPRRAQTSLGARQRTWSTNRHPLVRSQSQRFTSSTTNSPVFPQTPKHSVYTPYDVDLDLDTDEEAAVDTDDDEWGTDRPPVSTTTPSSSRFVSILRRIKTKSVNAWLIFAGFMTVPLWAAFASLVVALTPPVQHFLDNQVAPVRGFLSSAGGCSIPLTLVVLGAYFYKEPLPKEDQVVAAAVTAKVTDTIAEEEDESLTASAESTPNRSNSMRHRLSEVSLATLAESVRGAFRRRKTRMEDIDDDDKARPGETRTVFAAVFSRMILTPMIILPVVATFAIYDLHKIFEDPVFVVANVLLISSPPALTLAQITQAASGDAFERLISRTIFWAYCVFTPPLTLLYVVVGLYFSRL